MKEQLTSLLREYSLSEDRSLQSSLRDMLTELRHFAKKENLNFYIALKSSGQLAYLQSVLRKK